VSGGPSLDEFPWGSVASSADDVPGVFRGLRDRERAGDCLGDLWQLLLHQSTHYPVTAPAVPYLVDAALDPAVVDRLGVVLLLQHVAIAGGTDGYLGWEELRDAQDEPYERVSWDAVAAEHDRLRPLLDDEDQAVARATLALLARTGDNGARTMEALGSATRSSDPRDRANAWLCTAVLGRLPVGATAPSPTKERSPLARFGAAVAGLRFGGPGVGPGTVDELCSVFTTDPAEWFELGDCEFFSYPNEHANVAVAALGCAAERLRAHANRRLLASVVEAGWFGEYPLTAYLRLNVGKLEEGTAAASLPPVGRDALAALVEPLTHWQGPWTVGPTRGGGGGRPARGGIWLLEDRGLPGNPVDLAAWLGIDLPPYLPVLQAYADALPDVFAGPDYLPPPDLGELLAKGSGNLTVDLLSGATSLEGAAAGHLSLGDRLAAWLAQQADQDEVPLRVLSSATLAVRFRVADEALGAGGLQRVATFKCSSELRSGERLYSNHRLREQRWARPR
jgi:hypothetical protein